MRAILEFNLPDDQMEFNRANQSLDMAFALFDILQLRKTMEREFESYNHTPEWERIVDFMTEIIASIIIAWPLWMIASEINQLNKK